jgi:hypothetical protein
MLTHRRLFLSLALSALVGLTATSGANAAPVSMSIDLGGGAFSIDPFVLAPGPTATDYGVVDLVSLNATLAGLGSAYQFDSLGGSSNFPGDSTQGFLKVNGGIKIVPGVGGANTFLQLIAFEDGFSAPTGPTGTLSSSSTGNFLNQVAGAGHEASGAFNATVAGPYSVLSSGTDVNPQTGMASVGVAPVAALYTLTNTITFGLTPDGSKVVSDGFSAQVTIAASAVPEPASLVTMLMGIPLPLVVLSLLRRRRLARA